MAGRLGKAPSRFKASAAMVDDGGVARRSKNWLNTTRWQKLRIKIMRRDAVDISDAIDVMPERILFKGEPKMWPRCTQTGVLLVGGKHQPNSPVVDHIVPHRGDPDLFWDEDNLQTVSKVWHDRVKQQMEKRGLV